MPYQEPPRFSGGEFQYAYLERIPVTVGQTVEAGNVIGLSGSTGHSTGPPVHYEVRVDGNPVPPVAQG